MHHSWLGRLVIVAAVVLAVVSARPYAGSWNDGSRLATVESLVDRGTLAIDDSPFVRVPAEGPAFYEPGDALLRQRGTLDKLFIDGHYYSDKSPVPALLLAGVYGAWRAVGGPAATERPGLFCLLMTWMSSGVAFVVAVACVAQIGRRVGLAERTTLLLTVSFVVATIALPYTRYVNNHGLLLGVAAALTLAALRLTQEDASSWRLPAWLGGLSGFAYAIDLGAGPVFLVAAFALVAYRCRRLSAVVAFGLAALPCVALNHAVNYAVGGTFAPANSVAAYLDYPGSPFNATNMTGGWKHASIGRFAVYALALLGGQRGFFGHNWPLLLALPALALLERRRSEMMFAVVVGVGVWLMYAANSTNASGRCLSVRWFVPLLAPGYLLVAAVLRARPHLVGDLVLLSIWGGVVAALGWWQGPWERIGEAYLWPIRGGVLLSWLGYRLAVVRSVANPPLQA